MKKKKGFTLIELLVVVLIIGILAAIALPQYRFAVGRTRFATLKENTHIIKSAMDRYFMAQGAYTNSLEDLDMEIQGSLSSDKNQVFFPDSSRCYIGGSSIFCRRTIFGITMEYALGYTYGQQRPACVAISQNDIDIANRICQQETGKKTGIKEGTWTLYYY